MDGLPALPSFGMTTTQAIREVFMRRPNEPLHACSGFFHPVVNTPRSNLGGIYLTDNYEGTSLTLTLC